MRSSLFDHIQPAAGLATLLTAALCETAVQAEDFCFTTTPYEVQQSPSNVVQGDFNGDGWLDLVAANHDVGEDTISVLFNNGDGTFAAAIHYPVEGRPYWLGAGDLDGDADQDVIVSNFFGHTVAVFLNDGGGSFSGPVHYATGFFPTFVALAHLDGDADLDVAVANSADSTVSILMNNGDGAFAKQVTYGVGVNCYGVTAGDFNNDTFNDLAVANYDVDADAISVLMNNGNGTFAKQVTFPVNDGPVGIANADLNADGYVDLVATDTGSPFNNTLSVLMNDGSGNFGAPIPYTVGVGPYSIVLHDLNDDGSPDIVSANEGDGGDVGDISVLINNGDGTFGPTQSYFGGNAPLSVAIGDLDGNTTPELAVAAYGDFNIFVLFNQYPAITQDPIAQSVSEGGSAIFTVAVSGAGPFTFQWRRDGIDLTDGSNVLGSNTDTLTIDPATAADAASYDVIVSNDCAMLLSAAAALKIVPVETCTADIAPQPIGNGVVDVDDLLEIINAWGESGIADIAPTPGGDGTVNVDDLLAVINAWGPCD